MYRKFRFWTKNVALAIVTRDSDNVTVANVRVAKMKKLCFNEEQNSRGVTLAVTTARKQN